MSIIGINVNTSTELPISERKWFRVGQLAWLKDQDGLIVNAVEETLDLTNSGTSPTLRVKHVKLQMTSEIIVELVLRPGPVPLSLFSRTNSPASGLPIRTRVLRTQSR